MTEEGEYAGITSDYIKLLNNRSGLNLSIVKNDNWSEAVLGIKNKTIDVLPCIGKTLERQQFLNYSLPYIEFHRVIITRQDTPFISGINEITNWKVGVQRNSSHQGYLLDNTPIIPLGYGSLQNALLAVSDGEIDAFVGNIASSTYWIRKINLTNLIVSAPVYPGLDKLHFGVRDDWPLLISILNKGLQSITPAEEIKIQKNWVSVEYNPGISKSKLRTYIIQITFIIIGIGVIILFWIRSLNREIKARKKAELNLEQYAETLEERVKERTTEIHSKQKELEKNLSEKEALLKELHHRVKNNLQMIISLLNLQLSDNEEKDQRFLSSINRIQTMAAAYENLYLEENLEKIPVEDYIKQICYSLASSF